MSRIWHAEAKALIGSDGRVVPAAYFVDESHVRRWSDAGFDVPAAADRLAVFFDTMSGDAEAFAREERRIALASGISEDDPLLWRIDSFPRHFGTVPFIAG